MLVGKGVTLGEGIAADTLSVGRDKGVAVETCSELQADNERDSRQTEMRTCLKSNLDCIGHLCKL